MGSVQSHGLMWQELDGPEAGLEAMKSNRAQRELGIAGELRQGGGCPSCSGLVVLLALWKLASAPSVFQQFLHLAEAGYRHAQLPTRNGDLRHRHERNYGHSPSSNGCLGIHDMRISIHLYDGLRVACNHAVGRTLYRTLYKRMVVRLVHLYVREDALGGCICE